MEERIAVYPGTFDPMTKGHLEIVKRARLLFDKVIVAVGRNREKKAYMSVEERLEQIRRATKEIGGVEVVDYAIPTVDLCREKGARYIVRGIRNAIDFEYERNIADINRLLAPEVESVFLMATAEMSAISSSMVREMIAFGKDATAYIA